MSLKFISLLGNSATNVAIKLLACVYTIFRILGKVFQVRHREKLLKQHVKVASQDTRTEKIEEDKLHPCWQRIQHLEAMVTDLFNKPSRIPPDKEDMIVESFNRIRAIEYDLQKTKKVSSSDKIISIFI